MIGLKRHTVAIVEYQPHWAELFHAESTLLNLLIGDIVMNIQHVGSTSVPGLPLSRFSISQWQCARVTIFLQSLLCSPTMVILTAATTAGDICW